MSDKRNYTMISSSSGENEHVDENGVVAGHAYSMLEIIQFTHNGEDVRLLRLRNPWGSGEWEGDWSDNSSKWTPALREKYNVIVEDDGTFCIPFEAYMENYVCSTFCMELTPEYCHSNIFHSFGVSDTSELPQAFFSFTLTKEVDFMDEGFGISVLQ